MLLFVLIGLTVWALVAMGTVALCVQAARADRLQAHPDVAPRAFVHAARRRHVTARTERRALHPTA